MASRASVSTALVLLLVGLAFVTAFAAAAGTGTNPAAAIEALTYDTKASAQQYCLLQDKNNGDTLVVEPCENGEARLGTTRSGRTVLAMAYHAFTTTAMGWDFLEVVPFLPSPRATAASRAQLSAAYYRAGLLEGYVTAVNSTQRGMPGQSAKLWNNVSTFLSEHVNYMNMTANSDANSGDKFWARVAMMLQQVQGMADGYNMAVADQEKASKAGASGAGARASFMDAFIAAMYFDINFDIIPKFTWTPPAAATTTTTTTTTKAAAAPTGKQTAGIDVAALPHRPSHCSAIVKVTHDDVWMAHTSWFEFSSFGMRRLFKTYHFDTTVRMSSYVGYLYSGDDWYVTSKGLAIFETSLSNFNFDTLKAKIVPQAVSTFIRVMAASYLTSDSKAWAEMFARENGGTYNNQYGVVNVGAFIPTVGAAGAPPALPDNFMWIAEQLPGVVGTADVTPLLRTQGYFPSFNVAHIASIYAAAGYDTMLAAYGDFFSFNETTRAKIFRRNQSSIATTADVQQLIRYNGILLNDPLSAIPNCEGTLPVNGRCHPALSARLSIANRGDFAPPRAGNNATTMGPLWSWFTRGASGAYDGKVFSWKDGWNGGRSLKAYIVAGPTQSNGLPPFSFTANRDLYPAGTQLPPEGLPDTWDFDWVGTAPATSFIASQSGGGWDKESTGAVVGGILGIIGLVLVVIFLKRNQRPRSSSPVSTGSTGQRPKGDAYQSVDVKQQA